MSQNPLLPYYTGNPQSPRNPNIELPIPDSDKLADPEHYLASPELAAAVNVAIELGMPLLLTGDPGCGKSRLSDSVACELGLNRDAKGIGRALRFTVKSDTEGRDLFYRFDTLGRFHASQHDKEKREPREFITYNPLGKAILRAKGKPKDEKKKANLKAIMRDADWNELSDTPERNVVLIDEIDKAPREVPNDLLTEIENLSFTIPELFHHAEVCLEDEDKPFRPIVIITSNSERDLPPAFLRRCIFFHLTLPPYGEPKQQVKKGESRPVTLHSIVEERLGNRYENHNALLGSAMDLFRNLRESSLEQKPSTAELLQWLLFLSKRLPAGKTHVKDHPELEASLGVLVKPHNPDERQAFATLFSDWLKAQK